MIGLRTRLRAIAFVVVSVVTATVTLGALRTCWGTEHRHAGVAEPACAMHHGAPPPGEGHGHHGHAPDHSSKDGQQITCNCAADADAPLVTPHAIVATRATALALSEGTRVTAETSPRLPDSDITPLSPPPRSLVS
jgi:hypothetical protein